MLDCSIVAGLELEEVHFTLDDSLIGEYLFVVDDHSDIYEGTRLVPPSAVAALGVRTFLERLTLPPGTIHVAQELTIHSSAICGQRVSCRATVARSSQRRDGRFLVLEFTVTDNLAQPILDGRTTLMVPGQDG